MEKLIFIDLSMLNLVIIVQVAFSGWNNWKKDLTL